MSGDRRRFLNAMALTGLGAASSGFLAEPAHAAGTTRSTAATRQNAFRFCLNTSTIRGQELGIEKEVDVAATAGYDAIEPWIPTLRQFVEKAESWPICASEFPTAA